MSNIWKDRNYSKDFYEDYKNDYCYEYITINQLDSNFLLYSINKHIVEESIYDIKLDSIEVRDCTEKYEDKSFQALCKVQDNETLQSIFFIIHFYIDYGWNVYNIEITRRDYAYEYDIFTLGNPTNYILDIFKEHVEEMLQIKKKHCNEVVKDYKSSLSKLSR